jgi:hypothetical protein
MLPFIIYFVTAVVTGFHLYTLLSLAVYGVPINPLQLIALLGSLCLLIAAYVSLFRPLAAARLALIALLVIWCFYGPAIARTVRNSVLNQMVLPYLATVLLVLATVYSAVVCFGQRPESRQPTWIFPTGAKRSARISVIVGTLTLSICFIVWFSIGAGHSTRRSVRFLIPAGYSGWVRVEFEVQGVTQFPVEAGHTVAKIPPDGLLRTSSPEQYGWAKDSYYFYSGDGMQSIPEVGPGRLIWGKINGETHGASGKRKYEEFFVGTEQQYKNHP